MRKTLVALVAGTALVAMAGCSATRTQRAPGEHVDDAVLLTSVKAALIDNSTTKAHDINVEVNRGVVQLNGDVESQEQKSEATKVARNVDGVKEVKNNLTVQQGSRTAGEYVDDSILTAKVKAKLIESSETKAHQINVETNQGVVHLSGFVNDQAAKSAAGEVARSVTGVKDVKNELSVKSY